MTGPGIGQVVLPLGRRQIPTDRHAVLPFNRKEEDNRRARNMPVGKAPKKPHGPLRKEGFTPSRRKPLCCIMPETGLEPALPLQEPGPQPGASANSATPAHIALILGLRSTVDCPPGYDKIPDSVSLCRACQWNPKCTHETQSGTKRSPLFSVINILRGRRAVGQDELPRFPARIFVPSLRRSAKNDYVSSSSGTRQNPAAGALRSAVPLRQGPSVGPSGIAATPSAKWPTRPNERCR